MDSARRAAPGEPPEWPDGARCIAHVDLDSFFCSVEMILEPSLCGRPLAVAMTMSDVRHGVVASASYAARAYGVHSAQPLAQARACCPQLTVVPARRGLYGTYSARVMKALRAITTHLQQISIDEAFLEVPPGIDGWQALLHARATITDQIGLPCSFGIAANKLVAKIATGQGKPEGFVVVPPGTEAAFLAPLPVTKLWGVGHSTADKLHDLSITTIGELAATPARALADTCGPRRAAELTAQARGIDDSPLVTAREHKSISTERTFLQATADARMLWVLLQEMARLLSDRLTAERLQTQTIGIKLRLRDWRLLTRDQTVPHPTTDAEHIATVAAGLMRRHWHRQPLRLLGLRLSSLTTVPPYRQATLFPDADRGSASS